MLDMKLETLITVASQKSFTKAAQVLCLTQPAVSHHIKELEEELGHKLIHRVKGTLLLTREGDIAVNYAKRLKALYEKMKAEMDDEDKNPTKLRIGITHTAESNAIPLSLAKYSSESGDMSITIITNTLKKLYAKLENYELDLAIADGKPDNPNLNSFMLDTDYLVCVMSNNNPLARKSMIRLSDLKKEKMILRLPSSASRVYFESMLANLGESLSNFNVIMQVDNIATIKDLIRKDFGVSILAKSTCQDEIQKGKITVLPIENMSMVRETNIIYNKDFTHIDILNEIAKVYHEVVGK